MQCTTIMTRSVIGLRLDDTLRTACSLLKRYGFHHLPVIDENQLVGIVSDRDILRNCGKLYDLENIRREDESILSKKVHLTMTRNPITIKEDCTIIDASQILLKHKISCLLVTDNDNHLLGILSWKDILQYFLDKEQVVTKPLPNR